MRKMKSSLPVPRPLDSPVPASLPKVFINNSRLLTLHFTDGLIIPGRDTLEQLEDTRLELRRVQDSWSSEQAQWKREREEARITMESTLQKHKLAQDLSQRLEETNEELATKNRDLRQQISGLEEEVAMVKSRSRFV